MAGANNAKTKLSLEQRQTKNAAYKLNKIDNEKLKAGILCLLSTDFQTIVKITKGNKKTIFQKVNIGRLKRVLAEMKEKKKIDWIDHDISVFIKIKEILNKK